MSAQSGALEELGASARGLSWPRERRSAGALSCRHDVKVGDRVCTRGAQTVLGREESGGALAGGSLAAL